jgi:mRNA-degrading endonuclease RelE of RelBE toxin-antitoxin system
VSDERALRFTRTAEKELRRLDPPIRARASRLLRSAVSS